MGQDTEELKREIENTRDGMSETLDAIGDRVMPGRVVQRNKNKARAGVDSLRDRIMGTAHDAKDKVAGAAGSLGDSASSGADSVRHAPEAVRSQTQGAPLITGAIAFGIGFLVAAAFPPSEKEKQASAKVVDALEPVKEQLTESAHEIAGNLKEPAMQAAQTVKDSATESVQAVTSTTQDAVASTKDQAKQSVDAVKNDATGSQS